MATDALDIVASTAEAAFATDEEGRIVIWNQAAERHLGYSAARVLGKPCEQVLCGRDVFGNRFCDTRCPLEGMVSRREPIRRFNLDLRRESGQIVRAGVSVIVVPGPRRSHHTIIHILQPATEAVAPLGPAVAPPRPAAVLHGPAPASAPAPPPAALTTREVDVLRLLADGRATEEIADSLFISITTVRNHVQNILKKLDVHSKLEAVSLALRFRLI